MENQNNPAVCVNFHGHGSEKSILESTVANRQSDNNILPDLNRLQTLSQAAFFSETLISTSQRYPICPNFKMFNPEGIENTISVGNFLDTVTPSTEDFQVNHAKGATSYYPNGFAFPPMFSNFKDSFVGGHCPVAKNQDEGVCNGWFHEETELDPSLASRRRFILFDQTGSTGRILFHPSQIPLFSLMSTDLKASALGNYIDWETDSPAHREIVVSTAYAALQKTRADRLNSISLDNIGNEFVMASAEGEESTIRASYYGSLQERTRSSDSELHEDTEDLEALLSSDSDESSTGHSPSEIIRNNGHFSPSEIIRNNGHLHMDDDFADVTSSFSVKRRKIDTREYQEDVDYVSASVKETLDIPNVDEKCMIPNISVVETSSWESAVPQESSEDVKDDNYYDVPLNSYSISDECTSLNKSNDIEHVQAARSVSTSAGSFKRSKREKIKRNVRFLKSIIPGGNDMETAMVLNEAVQYVKLLQMKVKKLESSQLDLKK